MPASFGYLITEEIGRSARGHVECRRVINNKYIVRKRTQTYWFRFPKATVVKAMLTKGQQWAKLRKSVEFVRFVVSALALRCVASSVTADSDVTVVDRSPNRDANV